MTNMGLLNGRQRCQSQGSWIFKSFLKKSKKNFLIFKGCLKNFSHFEKWENFWKINFTFVWNHNRQNLKGCQVGSLVHLILSVSLGIATFPPPRTPLNQYNLKDFVCYSGWMKSKYDTSLKIRQLFGSIETGERINLS